MPPDGARLGPGRISTHPMSGGTHSNHRGMSRFPHAQGRARTLLAGLLVAALAVNVLVLVGVFSVTEARTSNFLPAAVPLGTLRPSTVPGGEVSSCGVLNTSAIDALVASTYHTTPNGTLPSQNFVDAGIAQIFSVLCQNPTFVALVEVEGASNFSFGLTVNAHNGTVVPSFMFVWVSGNLTYQEYWNGNLTTDQLSGPFLVSHPSVYSPPPAVSANPSGGQLYLWLGLGLTGCILAGVLGFAVFRRGRRGRPALSERKDTETRAPSELNFTAPEASLPDKPVDSEVGRPPKSTV